MDGEILKMKLRSGKCLFFLGGGGNIHVSAVELSLRILLSILFGLEMSDVKSTCCGRV